MKINNLPNWFDQLLKYLTLKVWARLLNRFNAIHVLPFFAIHRSIAEESPVFVMAELTTWITIHYNSYHSGFKTIFKEFWTVFLKIPLKYGFQERGSFLYRCSRLLSPTFVEIKKSFTEMLLSFSFKNFRIFFLGRKQIKVNLSNVSML